MLIPLRLLQTVLLVKTADSPHHGYTDDGGGGVLRALWSALRQIAWGIDAMSMVRHGVEVPPDHRARARRRSPDRYPRL